MIALIIALIINIDHTKVTFLYVNDLLMYFTDSIEYSTDTSVVSILRVDKMSIKFRFLKRLTLTYKMQLSVAVF